MPTPVDRLYEILRQIRQLQKVAAEIKALLRSGAISTHGERYVARTQQHIVVRPISTTETAPRPVAAPHPHWMHTENYAD